MIFDYNAAIKNAATANEAFQIFEQSTKDRTSQLDEAFFQTVLSKLATDKANQVEQGTRVYIEMQNRGIDLQGHHFNKLICICTKVGDFTQANFFSREKLEKVKSSSPDVVTFNHFLSGYVKHKRNEQAFRLLTNLQTGGLADEKTQKIYNHFIRSLLKQDNLDEARRVYDKSREGFFQPDEITFNQLMDCYANQGDVATAMKLFLERPSSVIPNRIIFNTLTKVGVIARNSEHIAQAHAHMLQCGFLPDENLHKHCWKVVKGLWAKPTDREMRVQCEKFYKTCKKIVDVSWFAWTNREGFLKMEASRTAGSNTLARDVQAIGKWNEAEQLIKIQALKKLPLTSDFVCQIHRILGGTGKYRTQGEEVTAGGTHTYLYAPSDKVEIEMERFYAWLDHSLDLCDRGVANPIIIAAQAYQRFVSIHPFPNENGRTSRFVMDYVLQRYQLPPAALGKNILVAIFSFANNQATTSTAVEDVLKGVKESYKLLGVN